MKKYMIAAVLAFSASIKINAQVSGNANEDIGNAQYNAVRANPTSSARFSRDNSNDSTITVSIKGLINIMPDTYVATFHVVQTGETAEVTNQLMLDRINKLKIGLVNAGI
ncbi:hypothetical protein, partial [Dyadobacter sp.]|uniref:hypothetical protein n=1 Tax=Dyadobacter sp. TaxID=1914288 RepID=UPI003F6E78B7